jgi:hypothetical protein
MKPLRVQRDHDGTCQAIVTEYNDAAFDELRKDLSPLEVKRGSSLREQLGFVGNPIGRRTRPIPCIICG